MTNIVMLVKDRLELTMQALRSLHLHTAPNSYTVTIVDDNSSPTVRRELLHWVDGYDHRSILTVQNSGHTLSQLKNLGVAWSEQRFGRGEFLYISDCDVWFAPDWLKEMRDMAIYTERFDFRLWGGQVHPFHQGKSGVVSHITEHEVLDGPSWLMRWKTWDQFGPLDRTTAPGPCQSEEYGFCARLRGDECRIGVIKPHVVEHTGVTQTDGKPAPGAEARVRREGVVYL